MPDKLITLENLDTFKTNIESEINVKEDVSNKTTSLSASSTDTQYPSAKAVYDNVKDIREQLKGKNKGYVLSYAMTIAKIKTGGDYPAFHFYVYTNGEWVDKLTELNDGDYDSVTIGNASFNSTNNSVTVSGGTIGNWSYLLCGVYEISGTPQVPINHSSYYLVPIEILELGDDIYVTELNVPDRWVSNTLFEINADRTFNALETKSDLTNYYTKTESDAKYVDLTSAQTITGNKNYTGTLQKNGVNVATTDFVSANPTVPSGTTPTALTGLKVGSSYYAVSGGSGSSFPTITIALNQVTSQDPLRILLTAEQTTMWLNNKAIYFDLSALGKTNELGIKKGGFEGFIIPSYFGGGVDAIASFGGWYDVVEQTQMIVEVSVGSISSLQDDGTNATDGTTLIANGSGGTSWGNVSGVGYTAYVSGTPTAQNNPLKFVKLTQTEYDNLQTVNADTFYIIINPSSYNVTITLSNGSSTSAWQSTTIYDDFTATNQIGSITSADGTTSVSTSTGKICIKLQSVSGESMTNPAGSSGGTMTGGITYDSGDLDGNICYMKYNVSADGTITISSVDWNG